MKTVGSSLAALALLIAVPACSASSGSTDQRGAASQPSTSVTIPPGYSDTLPDGAAPATAAAPGTASMDSLANESPTSVLPENQSFCEAVQSAGGLFSGAGP